MQAGVGRGEWEEKGVHCTDLITQVPKLSDLVGKFFVNIEMFKSSR